MTRLILSLTAALLSSLQAGAVEAGTWRQSEFAEFEKATLKNVALRSDGRLSLGPVFQEILDSSTPYLWALAEDSKGNVYAGGGGPGSPAARVYVIAPDGTSRVFADLDALEVHALALDRNDRVYAATSPDAKVYRIDPAGRSEVFYDPKAKYAWAMVFDAKGDLYLATGDQGQVHRITPDGRGSVFYRTDQTHARSLAVDNKGNLIVGTEPDGLVIRVGSDGQGFVLFETPKREVTAVAAGPDGRIFAVAVANKTAPALPLTPVAPPVSTVAVAPATAQAAAPAPTGTAAPPAATTVPAPPMLTGGSEVYRIEPDGYARRIWNHVQAVAYAVALDPQGRPLLATGNRGTIYRVDSDVMYSVLAVASPTQVTALAAGRQGRIYAATGNIGKVFRLGPELEKEGTADSDVFDASLFSLWGRLTYTGAPNGGGVRFQTRSGNLERPRQDWSPWLAVTPDSDGGRVVSPRARFLQWRLTMSLAPSGESPEVASVSVAYLPRNAPPVIQQIEITAANYRFPVQSLTMTPSRNLTLQPLGRARRTQPQVPLADQGVVTLQYEKGQIGARWAASDENGDDLLSRVEIRGTGEFEWRLLRDKVKEKYLSWDSTAFADGEYRLRVTVSDLPSNPPGQELTAQLVSPPFLIDNSSPEITGLVATRSAGRIEARWTAKDANSLLQSAEYSVDGGEWLVAEPTTVVTDSQAHDYVLTLNGLAGTEHTLAVRVTDVYDNHSVAKTVVR